MEKCLDVLIVNPNFFKDSGTILKRRIKPITNNSNFEVYGTNWVDCQVHVNDKRHHVGFQ